MNKKKWMIICCLVLFVSFFGVKKLNRYYKEFMLEYRIASAISDRGEDFCKFYVSTKYPIPSWPNS